VVRLLGVVSLSGRREISIGLAWHASANGNLGVGALTVGNVMLAREAARALDLEPRFHIIEPASEAGVVADVVDADVGRFTINGRSMIAPTGYWALMGRLDCLLDIGAGDSFADIYGWKRFAYLMATKELAITRGVPLILSPQTIGPFTRQPYKALAGHVMTHAAAVVARDPESMAAVRSLAPKARAVQSVDVAFRLPFERPVRADKSTIEVGVNVSGLLFNGGYGGKNQYGLEVDYAALMRRFIAGLVARKGVRVHLFCHVNTAALPVDDDGRVADRLAQEIPGAVRAPDFRTPSEAKSYISGLDFVVAGRMHACIAAYSASVPVVPIAYSRKFSGLFGGVLNYPYQVPVKGLSTDQALDFLNQCFEERDKLSAAITEGLKVVESALAAYDGVLREQFQAAARRR
jgi:polysaccharide pyruvyl transferase WcaK-like protein